MHRPKTRYQLFLSPALSERLESLASQRNVPKSALLEQALTVWLDRMGASALEDRFGRRIELIAAALARMERNDDIIRETLALFIRYELSINAPLADNDTVGRAIARSRFETFVAKVSRRLASGKRSFSTFDEEGSL